MIINTGICLFERLHVDHSEDGNTQEKRFLRSSLKMCKEIKCLR